MFVSIVDLPLRTSEAPSQDLNLEAVVATLKQERRLYETSQRLTIEHRIPEEYHYFFLEWEYDFDPFILARIIEVESGWTETAIGPQNANGSRDYGLAQLNGEYINYFVESFWDDSETFEAMNGHHSLFIAANQLQDLFERLGTEEGMIKAYNIGIGSVLYGWRPISGERYLNKVKNIWTENV